ncbi:hypothetical protein V502_02339 [Pseudogymnoascus sp. VKM F-4520 (FW-2644)]|nr:hypothetical protein V502_02339 [Pseudogymnoascus sp. VKM F-4520 (FW-2644)]
MLLPKKTIFAPHLGGIEVGYRLSATTLDLSKPTVVLLNPFTATADYYLPEFENKTLTDALNLLAIEPLGHGQTRAKRTDTFTYWDSAIMGLQILEMLGIEHAYALGTSQGGWIAARMALLAPERIKGIILIGSSMDYESPRSRELGCWDGPAACSGLVALNGDLTPAHDFEPGDAYYDFLMEIGFGKNVDKATRGFWAKTIRDNYNGDEGKKRVSMAAVNLASRDGLHERLPNIRCPILWLQGTDDVVFSFKNAEEEIKLFINSAKTRLWKGGERASLAPRSADLISGVDAKDLPVMSNTDQEQRSEPSRYSDAASPRRSTDSSAPTGKRRRVALACSNCRHRKSRCDGGRPKCSLCNELGCDCLYEQAGTTSSLTVGRGYISRLEQRLEDIEEALKGLQQPQNVSRSDTSYSIHDDAGLLPNNGASTSGESSSRVPFRPVIGNTEISEVDTAEDSIDGMGAIKFTDEEDCGYFGPSSNIAFVGHISLAMTRANAPSPVVPSPSNRARVATGLLSVSRPHHVSQEVNASGLDRLHGGVNIYALPSEPRAWSLIRKYFLKTGQLLPFIHEQSFCETYFQMKRDNCTMARRTWLGLLNIVFAMAATLSIDGDMSSEKRIEESDVYYQRANSLCDKESRRNISVELVQYLLISGQYLQGTQKSVQAWTVHGLAITAAFQLGLHSPRANQDFSPLEREIRKRVWFGCILLDRTLSMTFGRPAIIPETYVKLDLPNILMQIVGNTTQNEASPQMDAVFYTATIKLYSVMYHIIDSCYGQNLGFQDSSTNMEAVSLVLAGERQLEEWKQQLLPLLYLRVSEEPFGAQDLDKMDSNNQIVERFNVVLSLRFHNLRILLHRPFLEKFLNDYSGNDSNTQSTENKILHQVGINSVQTCVNSAKIIISIVRTVVSSTDWHRDLLGAWNYSLFYAFNASLVVFGALLVAPKDSSLNSHWGFVEQSRPYFSMAIEALRNLDRGNRVVERCVQYLLQLSSALAGPTNPSDMAPNYCSLNMDPFTSQSGSACALQQMQSLKQLPMDMELSEFMINTDMDFLGGYIDVNRHYVDGQEIKDSTLFIQKGYVNGEWVNAQSGKTFGVYNPATTKIIGTCPEFSKADTEAAIRAAETAFTSFRNTTSRERARLLQKWYHLMVENSEDLANLITWESGKALCDARTEVTYAASFLEWFSEEAPRTYGDVIPARIPGNRVFAFKEPIGVCGLITPWNFPAAMVTRKVGPALAAGCTVVIKSPGETPFTVNALIELARRAGIPKGVINIATAASNTVEVGHTLTSSPIIRKISFTGSTAVGKLMMRQCAETTLKKVSLELGGNAPFIVFNDADVDTAVAGAISSKFRSSGQTCVCPNRLIVQDDIYDIFAAKLAAKVREFKVGDSLETNGVTHGPLIHDRAVAKVQSHVHDAEAKGGKVLVGGRKRPDLGPNFFEPTVITEMTEAMLLASDETFGPVAGLFRFKTEADAVALANKTDVGLAGYLFSKDIQRIWRVSEALQVGMIGVNTGLISDPATPFGGVKSSGIGKEGSKYGIGEYMVTKVVTLGGMGIPLLSHL